MSMEIALIGMALATTMFSFAWYLSDKEGIKNTVILYLMSIIAMAVAITVLVNFLK